MPGEIDLEIQQYILEAFKDLVKEVSDIKNMISQLVVENKNTNVNLERVVERHNESEKKQDELALIVNTLQANEKNYATKTELETLKIEFKTDKRWATWIISGVSTITGGALGWFFGK